ncbi:MAG TPA: VanZ family protein [Flavobacteriia bacterium]|nr:VanZ family protein [Flavobacteriia bacterium]
MRKLIKKLLAHNSYLIAIFTTIFVAYLSLRSGGVDVRIPIKNIDKAFHFTAYFVLTITWLFALKKRNATKLIVIVLILYGIALEYAQEYFTQDRTKDVFDALANTIGIIIAALFYKYIYNNLLKIFG